MSRFFSEKYSKLVPYTPGEQPKDTQYIKLNTNESPFPPSEKAVKAAGEAAEMLNLYPDPDCTALRGMLSERLGVDTNEVILTNGSDEVLNFAFMAFCDEKTPAAFADITYGFYSVFAQINCLPYEIIPLNDDFTQNADAYCGLKKTIFIANPNAPTGIALPIRDIEKILRSNPDNIVVIDEAYVDFGNESCIPLIHKYDNLLVTGTFSKSRSMAGARLGFGVASSEIIRDLNTVRYSTNPYNINRMTMAAGIGVLSDEEYTKSNCQKIIENREFTMNELRNLGFGMTDSKANFVFAKHSGISGEKLYKALKNRGILVRHFNSEKISDYNRITIGTREQMEALIKTVKELI